MKKNLAALAAMFIVMFGFPWVSVTFAPGDVGMAICFVLFFGVNTTVSMFIGIFAGLQVRQRWFLPFANAVMFLLGVWTVFDWGNQDFNGFAIAYLAIALVSCLTTIVVVRNIKKELNNN